MGFTLIPESGNSIYHPLLGSWLDNILQEILVHYMSEKLDCIQVRISVDVSLPAVLYKKERLFHTDFAKCYIYQNKDLEKLNRKTLYFDHMTH